MSDDAKKPKWPSWFKAEDFSGNGPTLELREHLFLLDLNLDIESQLMAVHGLLNRNRAADAALMKEIAEIEAHAKTVSDHLGQHVVDEWVDRLHDSVYQDVAHSMAAVGMLAPLIESLFAQCFQAIGRKYFPQNQTLGPHPRWTSAHQVQWDCRVVIRNGEPRKNVVEGIIQLSDALGVTNRLPADLKPTLSALFDYRNKMFHLGFEWPMAEREKFAKKIVEEKWPADWFSKATQGEEPWIYYMSPSFIEHVVAMVYHVLDGFSTYLRDDVLPKQIEQANGDRHKGNCGTQETPVS